MNPYSVLGLTPLATREEVKRAFHKLAHQHHPDKGGDAEKFKQISAAYAQVKDLQPQPAQHTSQNATHITYTYGHHTVVNITFW